MSEDYEEGGEGGIIDEPDRNVNTLDLTFDRECSPVRVYPTFRNVVWRQPRPVPDMAF